MSLNPKKPFHILIQENSFIVSFLVTGVSLFVILWTLPVFYGSNDDFAMLTIMSGKGGFPASPDAFFLNPILSYILYFLCIVLKLKKIIAEIRAEAIEDLHAPDALKTEQSFRGTVDQFNVAGRINRH